MQVSNRKIIDFFHTWYICMILLHAVFIDIPESRAAFAVTCQISMQYNVPQCFIITEKDNSDLFSVTADGSAAGSKTSDK